MIVIHFPYNFIKSAGIAAGLVQQNVATMELVKLTRKYNSHSSQSYPGNVNNNNNRNGNNNGNNNRWGNRPFQMSVDNRWAATLAGDLAEVTLLQSEVDNDFSVGAAGAWNSSTVPHWYFFYQLR